MSTNEYHSQFEEVRKIRFCLAKQGGADGGDRTRKP